MRNWNNSPIYIKRNVVQSIARHQRILENVSPINFTIRGRRLSDSTGRKTPRRIETRVISIATGRAINIEPRLNQRATRINVNSIHFIPDSASMQIACNIRVMAFRCICSSDDELEEYIAVFHSPRRFPRFPLAPRGRLVYLWLECKMNGALDVNLFTAAVNNSALMRYRAFQTIDTVALTSSTVSKECTIRHLNQDLGQKSKFEDHVHRLG